MSEIITPTAPALLWAPDRTEMVRALWEGRPTPPLAYLRTYGCQQNVADSEHLAGMLAAMGYGFTDRPEEADLILFNTCAVREHAEERVFGNVGALKHLKRRRPELLIVLCGCMMQQSQVAERIRRSYPYVDLVFGTHAMGRFPELVYRALTGGERVFDLSEEGEAPEGLPVRREGKIKAWLSIMHGCDNFCSYCIVPYVRGREHSRTPEAILEEAGGLIAAGYRDITLLGQNVNSYGKGLAEPMNFAGLLRQVAALPGDFRLRFMTSHPKDCTEELIETIAGSDKICSHIHLPVQSGSDRILRKMNRHYTREDYLRLIDTARRKIPGVSFTSDIIVGFPTETREDFEATLSLIREVEYDALFSFIYSPRTGTPAARMEGQIPEAEKSARLRELLDVQQAIGIRRYEALVGQTLRVLAEGYAKDSDRMLTGRSDANTIVNFPGDPSLIGRFLPVTVTRARNWAVEGVPAEENVPKL